MQKFTPLCLFLFRLAFEQDIEHGNTDGLGDCQSKQKCFESFICRTLEIFYKCLSVASSDSAIRKRENNNTSVTSPYSNKPEKR